MRRVGGTVIAVAALLGVALALALVLPAPSSDTRELLSWGLNPSLSTPKQPPLMQWMGFLVLRCVGLFGLPPTTFACVALQQALDAVGLAYVYATLRLWAERREAGAYTVLLAGATAFGAAPVAFALNADTLQFPFWAAMLYHALRAFETRAPLHFAALTLAAALAFYAKYTVALFALSLGVATLATPEYRPALRDARLYLCALAAALLVAPHLIAAPRSGAVGHATGALWLTAGLGFRLRNLSELALGFLAYLAPAWIFLGWAGLRGESAWAASPAPAARFVRTTALTSLALLVVLVVALGFKFPSRYDAPFLFLIWLALASVARWAPPRWAIPAALGFGGALLVGGLATYGVFTAHPRQQEPLVEAAARLQAAWRARYACGPAYVMGDFWSAYGLGVSMLPPRPGAHLIEMAGLPGYDPALREREGAIVVYRDALNVAEIAAVFPGLDLSSRQRLTLPYARTLAKGSVTYEYVFAAPKGC